MYCNVTTAQLIYSPFICVVESQDSKFNGLDKEELGKLSMKLNRFDEDEELYKEIHDGQGEEVRERSCNFSGNPNE